MAVTGSLEFGSVQTALLESEAVAWTSQPWNMLLQSNTTCHIVKLLRCSQHARLMTQSMSCTFRQIIAKCPGSLGALCSEWELTRSQIKTKMPAWKLKEANAPLSAVKSIKKSNTCLPTKQVAVMEEVQGPRFAGVLVSQYP